MTNDDAYRLPRTVLPRRYELELVVDPDADAFSGTVAIDVTVTEPTDRIVLNALDLAIDAVTVAPRGASAIAARPVTDVEHERVELVLEEPLPPGSARIEAAFSAPFCEDLVGLYRSTFTVAGVEQRLAVTQFESTHARRAFPCFDEPDMKAVFAITLVVPDGMLAVSNAAATTNEPADDDMVRVRFAETMTMSTYLVAVVVGPLATSATRIVSGAATDIPLRVICPPGSEHLSGFALEVADAGIRFYEGYYDLPYPGDKIDLVAIPDFAFGAMENLGCITFREVLLLVDEADVSQPELQRVADVINHELAHMWFGDLVTMGWWNGIWLNEAFATFMEVTASDAFRPQWDAWTGFGLSRAAAFDTDSLPSTRPIEFPVHSPADAEAMFDILTYEKGASVLRMLEQYLGADRFRDGVRAYLAAHRHANTETTDLWDDLESSTGEPIRRIMDAWILQGGHPVISAMPTDSGVTLTQAPATITTGGGAHDAGDAAAVVATWPVPLVVTTTVAGATREDRIVVDGPVDLDLVGAPAAIRLNTRGDGFFRSKLPGSLRAVEAVAERTTALERFVLLDDTWYGLLSGGLGGDDVEEIVRLLAWRETDPSVWRRLAQCIRDLSRLRGATQADRSSQLAIDAATVPLAAVETLLAALGDAEATRWKDLRGVLFGLLGIHGRDAAVRTLAHELVHAAPEQARELPGSDSTLVIAALDVVAATGTAQDHGLLERRWRQATNPQESIRYLYALADTPVESCFDHLLDLTIEEVRSQDAAYVLRRALAHPRLAERAWSFLSEHWGTVVTKVPSSAVVRMLEGIRGVTDPALARRIESFTAEHPLSSGTLVLAQHVERMRINVAAATRLRASSDDTDTAAAAPS
ncbi:MAG: M1 family metallopeptidase [Actinobacteria bacterium]|nr:M1 family metallopeptidase [Actinomycetota bacterium]